MMSQYLLVSASLPEAVACMTSLLRAHCIVLRCLEPQLVRLLRKVEGGVAAEKVPIHQGPAQAVGAQAGAEELGSGLWSHRV